MTTSEPMGRELVEHFVMHSVTYILETEGRLLVIENVPGRVSQETGEQLFSPKTVARIQETVWARKEPARVVETSVYEFSD